MSTIDERRRHELYVALEELIGAEQTETLMKLAQPANGATKDDVAAVEQDVAELKHDVAGLKDDVAVLKQDVGGLEQALAHTEGMLNARIDGLGHRLDARFAESLRTTMWTLFFGFAGIMVAMTTALMTAIILVG